ncbi:MAG: alpha/beta hydrolase fold domain-containing protein [Planctomycetes bacterium]|nr:alpha/beta hydrolase [Phycisphaerae bacterium]NBB96025.1 alpha/beta hydrolase fold domain-containing protein [Planctomycetota bacterium]
MTDTLETCRLLDAVDLWPNGPPGGLADGATAPSLRPVLPQGDAPTAAIIVCPGGAYGHLADHEAEPVARWLTRIGVAGLVLRYRVAPHRHPLPVADVQRAIRLTRVRLDEWNIDPQRVGVLGFSAGGHLAASAATMFDRPTPGCGDAVDGESARPDAAVLCYPVILGEPYGHEGSRRNLLGPEPAERDVEEFSRDRLVSDQTPPTFLWHTADDPVVNVQNSLSFAASCREHGVPVELHVFPHGMHGIGLAFGHPSAGAWTSLCEAWLRSVGFARVGRRGTAGAAPR